MTYDSKDIAFAPQGEYWRQLRKICSLELLSATSVQSLRSIREEEISNLIRSISSNTGSPINLTEKINSLIYGITSRAAFGRKSNDQEAFISAMMEIIKLSAGFNLADVYPNAKWLHLIVGMKSKIEKLHNQIDRILGNIINEHQVRTTNTGKDGADEFLVDALLKYHEHGTDKFSLAIDNIKAVILDVFSGGSETSATTVNWAMTEMMKNTRTMKKAQTEVRQVFDGKGNVDETDIHELKYLKLIIK